MPPIKRTAFRGSTTQPASNLRQLTQAQFNAWIAAGIRGGGVARFNGSILYPTKIPDLIGIKDRKYIDHTGTHRHRDIGDLMRYAALVSFAEAVDFAGQRMILPETQRFRTRLPDEALYALALYVYSLEPPPNPNPFDAQAEAGKELFARERCGRCHTPPLYTNNKLTLARGFHSAGGCGGRHLARFGRHRPRPRAADAQGHGILQSAVAERRLVSRPIPARRSGGQLSRKCSTLVG